MKWIPPELVGILTQTPQLQRAYLVGGCVRDTLLGLIPKDFDVEVFGVTYEQLVEALCSWGRTDLVGRSFGVIKLTTGSGHTYDFSVPRRDSKSGAGHRGFVIEFDPEISLQDAAGRRDFTVNSLMADPRTGAILDFFGGEADLRNKVLRHTSPAFVEDPLRVLRGMQFAARFDLSPASETVDLCRRIKATYPELAVERVREEWFKWAAGSVRPSVGLHFLVATEWIDHYPEIKDLIGTPQDPEWHPEGDVFVHTTHCCDALARLEKWREVESESRIAWMLSVLAHDMGKPSSTREEFKHGRRCIVSPGHDEAGGQVAETFLNRINAPVAIRQRVIPLVVNHMAHLQLLTDRAVRRLARRLEPETIEGLCLVMTSDSMGRPPKPATVPEAVAQLSIKAGELRVREQAPKPILLGRHLLEFGLTPGRQFSRILAAAFEAQLDGEFSNLEGARAWLKNFTEEPKA
ncbi:MAG: polynucleotide adenylyltransferase [Opitutaceae bacterium]|nr:polynucleotide adenylyltransferase [Verrucomicrobiales bacterium]